MKNKTRIALFVIFSFFSYHSCGEPYLQPFVEETENQLSEICNSLAGTVQCRSGVIEKGPILFSWVSFLTDNEQQSLTDTVSSHSFFETVWSQLVGPQLSEGKGSWVTLYSFRIQENEADSHLKPVLLDDIYRDFADCEIGWKQLIPKERTRWCNKSSDESCVAGRYFVPEEEKNKIRLANSDAVSEKRRKILRVLDRLDTATIKNTLADLFPEDATYDLLPSTMYAVMTPDKASNMRYRHLPPTAPALVFLDSHGHAHSAVQKKQTLDSITLSLKETHSDWECIADDNTLSLRRDDTYIDEENRIGIKGILWNGSYRPEKGGLFRITCMGAKGASFPGGMKFRQLYFAVDGKAIPLSFTPEGGFPLRWRCTDRE